MNSRRDSNGVNFNLFDTKFYQTQQESSGNDSLFTALNNCLIRLNRFARKGFNVKLVLDREHSAKPDADAIT